MSRPRGTKNFIPGQQERTEWLRVLAERARAGDTVAIGMMILLSEMRQRGEHDHAA